MNKKESEKLLRIIEKVENHALNNIDLSMYPDGIRYDGRNLYGDSEPSKLFYFLASNLAYLMDNDPELVLSKRGVEVRRKLNVLIKAIAPAFLNGKHIIENRKTLIDPSNKEEDDEIILPNDPVIWVANHAFKDDTLTSVLLMKRHGYIAFGSLPMFFNTIDGLTAYANGVIMIDRNFEPSKRAIIDKCEKLFSYGADLLIFPEGVHNKTPNKPVLDIWAGVYNISKSLGVKVVPMAHYLEDYTYQRKKNNVYSVLDDPISFENMTLNEARETLRDTLATWHYLLMEKNSAVVSRDDLLAGYENADEYWTDVLNRYGKTVKYYDTRVETSSDYRPKKYYSNLMQEEKELISALDIEKETKGLVRLRKEVDFQRFI